ncbi:MAG TPA: hypothetical protein VNZ64_21695 [Candidatus Acidoferrum sp.]|nr:hypothetical protein [Candidatus Acidoferrum sp.]
MLLQDAQVLAGANLYNPASGTWTTTAPPPGGWGFAALLPDGLAWALRLTRDVAKSR